MSKQPKSAKNPQTGSSPAAGASANGGAPEAGDNIGQTVEKNGSDDDATLIPPIGPINGGDHIQQKIEDEIKDSKVDDTDPGSIIPEIRPITMEIVEKPVPVFGICKDVVLVVCGTKAAMPLLAKAWDQKANPAVIIPRIIDTTPFSELITEMMANDSLPDTFILVPANCFPTHQVDFADLAAFRVRRMSDGAKEHYTRLPVLLEATAVLKTLEALDNSDTYTEEEFFEQYNAIAHPGELAEEIGMSFGNTVAYAEGSNPCMAKLAEAMVRKKFICTSSEGFIPIKERLALLYDGK